MIKSQKKFPLLDTSEVCKYFIAYEAEKVGKLDIFTLLLQTLFI